MKLVSVGIYRVENSVTVEYIGSQNIIFSRNTDTNLYDAYLITAMAIQ